jgi:outer membrane protein OmpA-like peptidoglycan-associated protein
MRAALSTAVLCVAVGFAGCASTPINTANLEQARAEVQKLVQNPAAGEVSSRELSAARASLSQAEDALTNKKQDDIDHYSYLAARQAQVGEALIGEREAKQLVAQSDVERQKILLEARNAELEAQKQLAARETARGKVLTLSGVLFDTGKTTLNEGAAPTLDRVSSFMNQYPDTRLIVEGYTDNQGRDSTNQDLSQRRALAVSDALVSRGVQRDRIEVVGRGPMLPVASNDTAAGRQQNRRVEMVFSDASGRFASGAGDTYR